MESRYCPLTGKERFRTRGDAQLSADSLARRSRGMPSVYWCETCHAFHITHYRYTQCKAVAQTIEKHKPTKKRKRDMKIIIDNAYVPDGTSIGIKQLNDGGQQLQMICFDEEDKRMDLRFTYAQALELVEAIKLQLAKMTN